MPLKLAVVDDEEGIVKALRRLFAREYDFHGFTAPAAFLEAFSELRPAVLLTDLSMPGISGVELTQKVISLGKMTQVVMMTGSIDSIRVTEAYRQGVSDFILKPWEEKDLLEVIRTAGDRHRRWFKLAFPGQKLPG